MSEKKVAVGLGALSIVLIIVLVGAVGFYLLSSNSVLSNKDSEISLLKISNGKLNSQISDLKDANGCLGDQINDLNSQIENLKVPYLVNVGLGAFDESIRPPFTPNLRVSGYVCNVGTNAAYNAKLHIVAYFVSGATAIDTELPIGNGIISGGTSVLVDLNVDYSRAGSLASWRMTPQ